MDFALLKQVRQHIVEYPERFCAANWAWAANVRDVLAKGTPPEGFRCCIAGHVLLCQGSLSERSLLQCSVTCDDGFVGRYARDVLGATEQEQRRLFYPSQWAEPYSSAYYLAQTRGEEAKAAVGFLDFVLAQATERAALKTGAPLAPDRPAIASMNHGIQLEHRPA
jgi:hypothetical protein